MKIKKTHSITLYLLFSVLLYACSSNSKEDIRKVTENNELGEVSYNVTLYFSDSGRTKIKLETPLLKKISIYDENEEDVKTSNLICPEGMVVTFFDTTGNEESKLSSKYGKLLSEEQYLLVKDSVVFVNPKGEKLETELLHIYFSEDSITTPEKVKITTEDGVIIGKGLTSNTGFTKYTLNQITNSYYNFKEEDE